MLDDVRWPVLHMGCGHGRPTISDGGSFIAVARSATMVASLIEAVTGVEVAPKGVFVGSVAS
jgi:hypothetical protein